jgi:hypothetical protein
MRRWSFSMACSSRRFVVSFDHAHSFAMPLIYVSASHGTARWPLHAQLLLHCVVFGTDVLDEFAESKGVSFVGADDVYFGVGKNLVFHA